MARVERLRLRLAYKKEREAAIGQEPRKPYRGVDPCLQGRRPPDLHRLPGAVAGLSDRFVALVREDSTFQYTMIDVHDAALPDHPPSRQTVSPSSAAAG